MEVKKKIEERGGRKKKWPGKNLAQVIVFLNEMYPHGLNLASIAQTLGVSLQAVSHVFTRDDCRIGWLRNLAASYGYTVRFCYVARKTYDSCGCNNIVGYDSLRDFVSHRHATINSIATSIGISHQSIARAIAGDTNTSLSLLRQISDKLRLDIDIQFIALAE